MQKSVILYSVFDWRGRQNAEDAIGQAAQSPELRQPKRSAELHPCRPRCGERHGGARPRSQGRSGCGPRVARRARAEPIARSATICSTSRPASSRRAATSGTAPCWSCSPRACGAACSRSGGSTRTTEGLLLVTDDGALSHALMSPSRHVSKVYEAELDGTLVPRRGGALRRRTDAARRHGLPTGAARAAAGRARARDAARGQVPSGQAHDRGVRRDGHVSEACAARRRAA